MTTKTTIDTTGIPDTTGFTRTVTIPATRYRQGRYTFFTVSPSITELVRLVHMPDPAKPLEDNRVVQEERAANFGKSYVIGTGDEKFGWVCPPIIVRANPGEVHVEQVVHEFDNGTAWVLLRVDMTLLWLILDGQHRVLGFDIALVDLTAQIRKYTELLRQADENGLPAGVRTSHSRELDRYKGKLEELRDSHVPVALVEVPQDVGRQWFVDIARNARGVSPDWTVVLDANSPIHRIAMAVASSHVLLKDRVEHGQRARMSKNNPNLLGAKAVADIVKGVLVGPGRVTRAKDLDIAKAESASQQKVVEFLDSLLTGFTEFQDIVGGTLDPLDLREKSLLGSATMLRVLAVVWHDLRYGDPKDGVKPVPVGEIESFFQKLSPHMACFEDVKVSTEDGDTRTVTGVPESNKLWFPTRAFLAGNSAPQARQGTIKSLAEQMAGWARRGHEMLDSE
jgi:hypothetical protein